ncbi:hypothetical protein Aple_021870 [Acrocarpospora pleiomorpha]|uniref:Response regulatory domain-containing protein n=1 Tax=Acrocarpospora pleiomorpha TaxID=90975 RepID=A0A5M3XHZ5_9ACTN|nr:hypothetical protein Aple_021870 [Acrocarpospora pleiomorpha]
MTVRVLVADDQALVRAGLCGIVATTGDQSVVGQAATGAQAMEVAGLTQPDVVLMDVRMLEMDGLEATWRITASGLARVVMLTIFDLGEYVYVTLRGGAGGFLLKDAPPQDLLTAIRVVAAGEALPPRHPAADLRLRRLRDRARTAGTDPDRPGSVQRRDRPPPAHRPGNGQNPRVC